MMKNKLFLLTFLIASLSGWAQQPTFQWAKGIIGTDNFQPVSIAVDGSGNVYAAGYYETGGSYDSIDFDPGPNAYYLTSVGSHDIYILKLDASGNFIWAKSIGGTQYDASYGIDIDGSGNLYITGNFRDSVDFDPGPGVYALDASSSRDIFILKLDASGNFVWAKNMVGLGASYAVTVDANGNVYTTGLFLNTVDFDPGTGTFNLNTNFGNNVFISKLDASGNFVWAKNVWGYKGDAITTDGSGNVYITGYFSGTGDFDPDSSSTSNLTSVDQNDVFVVKLDASGNFIWAKNWATNYTNTLGIQKNDIVVDASGNVYTTGFFTDTTDFDPGAGVFNLTSKLNINSNPSQDIYISKLDANGNFVWAKSFGTSITDYGLSIALDNAGNVYTTGTCDGQIDFDPGTDTFNLSNDVEVFVSILDASGSFVWAGGIESTGDCRGYSLALDGSGNILIGGSFNSFTDFDPGPGNFNINGYHYNVFITKLNGGTVGIQKNGINKPSIAVYPVPNAGNFYIKSKENLDIVLYNVNGKMVFKQQITAGNTALHLNLKRGVYFISAIDEKGKRSFRKIVVAE